MPLVSTAHVKIGSVEYFLDESVDGHYDHRFRPVYVQKQNIAGLPGKEQIDPDRLISGMTDWSGGEGYNTRDPDTAPHVYRVSNGMNVRNKGQLQVRPKRTRTTVTSENESKQPYFAIGDGAVWLLQNTRGHFSTDYGVTWTSLSEANSGVTGFDADAFITAATGDERYVYYAVFEATGTKRRAIIAHDAVVGTSTTVVSAHDANFPYAALAIFNGRLYAWTGRKLYEIDVFETFPFAGPTSAKNRKIYDTGVDPSTSHVQGNQWTAGLAEAENSLFGFYSRAGQGGRVYRVKQNSDATRRIARPFWRAPIGFTIGSIEYQNGILYVAGHFGVGLVSTGTDTVSAGWGQLYAIPLQTMGEVDLGRIREFDADTNRGFHMQRMQNSYDRQILLASPGNGVMFVYDLRESGLSCFDHLKDAPVGGDSLDFDQNPNERIGDIITIGPKRLVSVFRPNSSAAGADEVQILLYETDTPDNRETDGQMATDSTTVNYLEESDWDDGYPLSPKALHGFHVQFRVEDTGTTSGLLANQRIVVKYSVDGGSYSTAGTVTSASTPVGPKGKVFLPVTGVSYYRLRIKYEIDNNTTDGVKPPIVYAVLRESSLGEWIEEWELIVRVKNESQGTRPKNRQFSGSLLRDNLEDLFQARVPVTFLDGYRKGALAVKADEGYTTHKVKLVEFQDEIARLAEGSARIVLRALPAES
jgi:hypothetical protein